MEICKYKDKEICAYDVTNMNYILNYNLKKEWKIAGKNGELKCPECGNEVILKANDPRKKIPHFSHKVSNEKCDSINIDFRESEQHKIGKFLIYKYLKNLYPHENTLLNYRFKNRRRADIYTEFIDGNKLAIEFQRTALDIDEWIERQEEYNKANINVIWILLGKEDELSGYKIQNDFGFFNQIMLNENEKVAIHFDLEKKKFILSKNMIYKDKYNEKNIFDKVIFKSYPIEEVIINTNGSIKCDFLEKYNTEYKIFTDTYSEKCEKEEQARREYEKKLEDKIKKLFEKKQEDERLRKEREEEVNKMLSSNYNKNVYCRSRFAYFDKVIDAINGDDKSIDILTRLMENYREKYCEIFNLIFRYFYLKGYKKAFGVYKNIISNSEEDINKFTTKENIEDLVCPYCNGSLLKKHDDQRKISVIYCDNSPKCKFSFKIDNNM